MSKIDLDSAIPLRIHRSQINEAIYNPRKITAKNRKNLKKLLVKHGLVDLLLWNKATGNLVSGHQRLSIIDEDKGHKDYELTVLKISVSLEKEKAINVSINNKNAQGDYDFDMLSELDIDLIDDGMFTEFELSSLSVTEYDEEVDTESNYISHDEFFAKKKAMRDKHKDKVKSGETLIDLSNHDTAVTVVFRDVQDKRKFLSMINQEQDEEFIHGNIVFNYLK